MLRFSIHSLKCLLSNGNAAEKEPEAVQILKHKTVRLSMGNTITLS